MNNNDFDKINMLYENTVNEGILDRAKARVAGVGGAIGGALKGAYYGATGNVAGAAAAAEKAKNAKLDSYKKSADARLEQAYNNIINDLIALNLINQNTANQLGGTFKQGLAQVFQQFIDGATQAVASTGAATAVSPAAPAAAPVPTPAAAPAPVPTAAPATT